MVAYLVIFLMIFCVLARKKQWKKYLIAAFFARPFFIISSREIFLVCDLLRLENIACFLNVNSLFSVFYTHFGIITYTFIFAVFALIDRSQIERLVYLIIGVFRKKATVKYNAPARTQSQTSHNALCFSFIKPNEKMTA